MQALVPAAVEGPVIGFLREGYFVMAFVVDGPLLHIIVTVSVVCAI